MRHGPAIISVGVVMLLGPGVVAQAPAVENPAFEVASIKRSPSNRPLTTVDLNLFRALVSRAQNGHLTLRGVPVGLLIEVAYDVKDARVQGGPPWLNTERYDVDARAGRDDTIEQMRPMLKALLEDRCKLGVHRETKRIPIYELSPVWGGINTKSSACVPRAEAVPNGPLACDSDGVRVRLVNDPEPMKRIEGAGISMDRLAEILSAELDQTVIDKTGFAGPFTFRLEFAPPPASPSPSASAVSLFTAVQEQLGLRLTATTGPVDVLVIDHIERPTKD